MEGTTECIQSGQGHMRIRAVMGVLEQREVGRLGFGAHGGKRKTEEHEGE